jgi:hypothetical protein
VPLEHQACLVPRCQETHHEVTWLLLLLRHVIIRRKSLIHCVCLVLIALNRCVCYTSARVDNQCGTCRRYFTLLPCKNINLGFSWVSKQYHRLLGRSKESSFKANEVSMKGARRSSEHWDATNSKARLVKRVWFFAVFAPPGSLTTLGYSSYRGARSRPRTV